MKTLLFILAVGAAGIGIEQPARAQPGGWCAEYDFGGHASARNCGFATLTVLGRRARRWRQLFAEPVLPAAVQSAVSTRLSLLIGLRSCAPEFGHHAARSATARRRAR